MNALDGHPAEPLAESAPGFSGTKATLLPMVLRDLRATLDQAESAVAALANPAARSAAWPILGELADILLKSAAFLESNMLERLCNAIAGAAASPAPDAVLDQVLPRLLGALAVVRDHADTLASGSTADRPIDRLCGALAGLSATGQAPAESALPFGATAAEALLADGAISALTDIPAAVTLLVIPETDPASPPPSMPAPDMFAGEACTEAHRAIPAHPAPAPEPPTFSELIPIDATVTAQPPDFVESTPPFEHAESIPADSAIDPPASDEPASASLEASLEPEPEPETTASIECIDLDALILESQSRLEQMSLEPTFGVIPDSAFVPASAFDVDLPDAAGTRAQTSEPIQTSLPVPAQSSAPTPASEPILELIVDLARQSDRLRSIIRSATHPGFGPPEVRADLFGALAHLDHLAADLHRAVAPDDPAAPAALHAMLVEIGDEMYGLPLPNVVEIIRAAPDAIFTICGAPVARLRSGVVPLLSGTETFGITEDTDPDRRGPLLAIIASGEDRIALTISRAIGPRVLLVRPHHRPFGHDGPVLGAASGDDGRAIQVIDADRLVGACLPRHEPSLAGAPA